MPYRFASESQNYSDYSSGRVFYTSPGHPAFPIRLAGEIFQRCLALRQANGLTNPVVLYDPCCGSAYHLSTLAYLHWQAIDTIIASDIDEDILAVAARNLSLLTLAGLEKRIEEIVAMHTRYHKSSHAAALDSAQRFKHQLQERTKTHRVETRLFVADATDAKSLADRLAGQPIDVVISDVPYGQHSSWQESKSSPASSDSPLWQMLNALRPILSANAIVAIAANKAQKCIHEEYRRVERFQIGRRQVILLQPIPVFLPRP